jgi:TolA-binding protein
MKQLISLLAAVILFAGCNNKSADTYMKQAKAAIEQKKITDAVKAYELLVSEFPKDSLAPEALYQLGSLYQNKMVPGIKENESIDKAISTFKSVFDKYPDSKQAPVSLFMAGFLQANELKRYSDATTTYNTFLQKYPKNDMAQAAKDELEYMGLTPEQILEKKSMTSK